MVWVIGTVGFFIGFALGQAVLLRLLRGASAQDLVQMIRTDKKAKAAYGLLNWLFAGAGTVAAVFAWHIYKQHS